MNNKITMILTALLAIAMCSCGQKKEEAAKEKNPPVHGVKIEILRISPVEETYEAVGTVRPKTASILSSRVVGNIVAIHVREGDRVRAGQLLLEIDNRDAAAQLKKAQATLREAEEMMAEVETSIGASESAKAAAEADKALATSTFNRYRALFERGSVSQQEFEEAQARYLARTADAKRAHEVFLSSLARKKQALARIEQANAEVESTRLSLGYTRVLSPIAGIVAAKPAEVGTLATPGTPLLEVEDDTRYRLEVVVEESQSGKIHLGETVRLDITARGEKGWLGRVAEIGPAADPATRSFIVKVDLPEMPRKTEGRQMIRSGLFGKALFATGQRRILTVPEKAVIQRGQLQEVYVVDSADIVHLRLIKTGKVYGDRVEALAGIKDGEIIITEGVEAVREGSKISRTEG
jgi:RND family efflux transporter MFP subunit